MHSVRSTMVRVAFFCVAASTARAQSIQIDTSAAGRQQIIDGFGTCLYGTDAKEEWFKKLYYDDLGSSILRVDLTPPFKAPYSDHMYNSPWYGNTPSNDNCGPEGNCVRTYTDAESYTRTFGGQNAQIGVMGPNIDQNVALFDFSAVLAAGGMAQLGQSKAGALGGFKLYGSLWSPAPWLKLSSQNTYEGGDFPSPTAKTPWPFIWAGNFAGGILDTTGAAVARLDDSSLGGTGPTSALTQFARSLAAYLRGFQNTYGVRFYAISLQNEINFEEYYNSCSYPLSSQYIAILKVSRAELDKYPDLKDILIAGPEDLLGASGWSLWQYGGGESPVTHKNLQYLTNIAADPTAASALGFFNIHGYASDGVSSVGADPLAWRWWTRGWTSSTRPDPNLPASVDGFMHYGKKSWMTETSGEATTWLDPANGFPSNGAWSIALKIHQAITVGRESAWLYWQTTDGSESVNLQTLTDKKLLANSPKYVAAKHFFRFIRPGAVVVSATVSGAPSLSASAFLHEGNGSLTVVLINASASAVTASLALPGQPSGIASIASWTSSEGSYWKPGTVTAGGSTVSVSVPGWGVVTLVAQGQGSADAGVPPNADAGSQGSDAASDGGEAGGDAASQVPAVGSGCGCSAGGGVGAALVLAGLPFFLGRRRASG